MTDEIMDRLVRYAERRRDEARLARNGVLYGMWDRHRRWLRQKRHIYGKHATQVVIEELGLLREEYSRPTIHARLRESRDLRLATVIRETEELLGSA
jgi:hypothetical protein